ncbi:MAG: sensor histidine kinase [Betaproteobacteria bacterium]
MKRSLAGDVQQNQLVVFLAFTLLTSLVLGGLLWEMTIEERKASLIRLSQLIERAILQAGTASRLQSLAAAADFDGSRRLLEPLIHPILDSYPDRFTGGFYCCPFDRIIVGHSRDRSAHITGLRLSQPRQAWILRCDNPVVIDGVVIGYTFANMTLTDMFASCGKTVSLLFVAVVVTGSVISLLVSRGITRRILTDVKRLSFLKDQANLPVFDYEEFDAIARVNRQSFSALQNALDQKAAMLNHFPWGYVIWNSEGVIVDINERGAAIFGLRRGQIIGRKSTPEEGEAFFRVLEDKIAVEGEYGIASNRGKHILYHHTFPLTLDSGEEGAMSWFLDLTEQKKMELYAQHQDRLSLVGEMTSIICHDVRNPLASIKLIAQLARVAPEQAEQVRAWERIDQTVDDIMNYFETVLAFCRPSKDGATVCRVRGLFDNVITMFQGKCDYRHIKLVSVVEDPDLAIRVNPVDFQHVLANLVNNAFEAISSQSERGQITLKADQGEGQVHILVCDTGPGIPEAELSRIWDMFYTTKDKGSGIGLSIAKRLVEQAGGRIGVAATGSEGTTFEILMPLATAGESAAQNTRWIQETATG